MNKIVLLSTGLILTGVLTACNSTVKPDCWKATHNTVGKDCNSGSGFTMNSPRTGNKKKTNVSTDVSTPDVPSPDTDEGTHNNNPQAPEDNTNDSTTPSDNTNDNNEDNNPSPPEDNTNPNPPNQSNSNDIEGYDPFGGLYGPGT